MKAFLLCWPAAWPIFTYLAGATIFDELWDPMEDDFESLSGWLSSFGSDDTAFDEISRDLNIPPSTFRVYSNENSPELEPSRGSSRIYSNALNDAAVVFSSPPPEEDVAARHPHRIYSNHWNPPLWMDQERDETLAKSPPPASPIPVVPAEFIPRCADIYINRQRLPLLRRQTRYSSLEDLCSFTGRRARSAPRRDGHEHATFGLSRNMGCECVSDGSRSNGRTLHCSAPPLSDPVIFQDPFVRELCEQNCFCDGEALPFLPDIFALSQEAAGGGGEIWTSGDFTAYWQDGQIVMVGPATGDGGSNGDVVLSVLLPSAGTTALKRKMVAATAAKEARAAAAATASRSSGVGVAAPKKFKSPTVMLSGATCGLTQACSGPRDCVNPTDDAVDGHGEKHDARSCRCTASRASVAGVSGWTAVCGILTVAAASGKLLGRRGLEVEAQQACACNSTYISLGCCGSLDGIVSEDQSLHLGALLA